jgi:hypothetical protein
VREFGGRLTSRHRTYVALLDELRKPSAMMSRVSSITLSSCCGACKAFPVCVGQQSSCGAPTLP